MTQMRNHVSPSALDRTKQTIHAAELFHGQARAIAMACTDADSDEIIVAAVTPDLAFEGIWTIRRDCLREHVVALDDGGWSMTFAPGLKIDEIEERCLRLARLSFARWEAMMRWTSRNR